jgi:hypothetical protein
LRPNNLSSNDRSRGLGSPAFSIAVVPVGSLCPESLSNTAVALIDPRSGGGACELELAARLELFIRGEVGVFSCLS